MLPTVTEATVVVQPDNNLPNLRRVGFEFEDERVGPLERPNRFHLGDVG